MAIETALRDPDFERALQLAHSRLRKLPKDARLWMLEGIALSKLGRDKEALNTYDRALRISPKYLAALEGAAELEYKAGSARARPLLEQLLKLRPDDPTTHGMLGVLAYKEHDCSAATKHFRASKDLISSQPVALAEYGSCLMKLQQPQDALPQFQQLLTLRPDDLHARYNLAVVQLAAGHASDAISTLQPLIQSTQEDPDVLDLASSAYEETGDTPQAVNLLRRAIVLDPTKARYYVDFATLFFTHHSFQVWVDVINAGLKQDPSAAQL